MNGVANGVYSGDRLFDTANDPWVDWSEQATIVGWSSLPTKRILYKINGNMIFFSIALQGTSNTTSVTFTVPFVSKITQHAAMGYTVISGASWMGGLAEIAANSNTVVFYRTTTNANIALLGSTQWGSGVTNGIFGNIYFVL